jgi:cell wall-associated NlpC family hydrolase
MSAPARRRAIARLALPLVTAGALGVTPALTGPADALTAKAGQVVVQRAAAKTGSPYQWGAEGPRRFDCSGFTQWVFARIGKHLPRTSAAQYGAVRHLSRSQRRAGDLVFFHEGGRVYHVGIYAGHGRIWHAPHTGAVVRLEKIWTSRVWYGRVR